MHLMLQEYNNMETPKFLSTNPHQDPSIFLEHSYRLCMSLGYSFTRTIQIVSYQILDVAYN